MAFSYLNSITRQLVATALPMPVLPIAGHATFRLRKRYTHTGHQVFMKAPPLHSEASDFGFSHFEVVLGQVEAGGLYFGDL